MHLSTIALDETMQKILNFLLSFLLLGLFLIPGETAACSSHGQKAMDTEQSCCSNIEETAHSTSHCEKDCCQDQEGDASGCSGNCGDKSCHNSSPTYCTHPTMKDSSIVVHFEDKNTCPIYQQAYYSLGFHSIWQPPKIS